MRRLVKGHRIHTYITSIMYHRGERGDYSFWLLFIYGRSSRVRHSHRRVCRVNIIPTHRAMCVYALQTQRQKIQEWWIHVADRAFPFSFSVIVISRYIYRRNFLCKFALVSSLVVRERLCSLKKDNSPFARFDALFSALTRHKGRPCARAHAK